MTELEKRGIPTVDICTEAWGVCGACEKAAPIYGMPNLPWAPIPAAAETYENEPGNVEQMEEAAALALPDIIAGLTTPLETLVEEVAVQQIATPGGAETPTSETITFSGKDYDEALDKFQQMFDEWGLSGGFTVVPPTKERVEAMLAGTSHSPDELVEALCDPQGQATIRKIAINAVMAGCEPEYLPVVVAGVKAAKAAELHLNTWVPVLMWLNGPIIEELNIVTTRSPGPASGTASKPNLAIGRAVNLCYQNIGGRWGDKVPLVTGENEALNPWETFHVEKGYDANTSTISAFSSASKPIELWVGPKGLSTGTPDETLYAITHSIRGLNLYPTYGGLPCAIGSDAVVLLTPQYAPLIADAGWTKADFKEYLWHNTGITMGDLRKAKGFQLVYWDYYNPGLDELDDDVMIPPVLKPEHFQVIVVGGATGFSPGWYCSGSSNGYTATESIDDWR